MAVLGNENFRGSGDLLEEKKKHVPTEEGGGISGCTKSANKSLKRDRIGVGVVGALSFNLYFATWGNKFFSGGRTWRERRFVDSFAGVG